MRPYVSVLLSLALFAAAPALAQTTAWSPETPPALAGFATALVMSGDDLFIGRTGEAPGFPIPPNRAGAVHVYRRTAGGGWAEGAPVSGAETRAGDGFGSAIAVSGNWLAVGAPKTASGGTVYLFERNAAGAWTAAGTVTAPEAAAGDEFGAALALAGDVLLIGAPGRDSARGAAWAWRRGAAGWGEATSLGTGTEAAERFGAAIAMDAGRALVSAPGTLPLGGFGGPPRFKKGSVKAYQLTGERWSETGTLAADSTLAFGYAMVLRGGEAMISSPLYSRAAGAVFLYRAGEGGSWAPAGRVAAATPVPQSAFGFALAASNEHLLVGAPIASGGVGQVVVFQRGAEGWTERQTLAVRGAGPGVLFGAALATQGDQAMVGGPMADFFEGTAYAYSRDPGTGVWSERGTVVERPVTDDAVTGAEVRCDDGKAGGYSCQDVDLLSFLPTSALGAKRGIMVNDIWGWTDPETGREYAILGRMDGTTFVDVSDPSNPRYLGELPLHEGAQPNLWRDIKVYRDHAFIVSDGAGPHGVQIFDLTRLRTVASAPAIFSEDAHYAGIASAHNIVINEATGFAYTVGNSAGGETCGGALHMIDIRNPKEPVFAGCHADKATGNARTGYTHDAQCVTYQGPDQKYAGREICFNASETAVGIADVTDKSAPVAISQAAYPNVGYTHQGWLSEDHHYFYLNDELDELAGNAPKTRTLVWDVASLEEPVLLTEFFGTTSASDHNLYVRGRYMYQSNYVSGLRIIDVADPANPVEVGYFDTVPVGENVPGFAGSWSNYPYFKSGTIVVSSMREGLFVLKHRKMELVP